MISETEEEMIERCRMGDREAWDRLFDLHYAAAGRFVFQVSPGFSLEDVEEVCQETFLAVIRNIRCFEGGSRLQTWIFRIAANKARDYRQKQQALKRGGGLMTMSLEGENGEKGPAASVASGLPRPDEVLVSAEKAAEVGRALAELEDPCREVIELRYFGDLSYDEIALELKVNPKTVSSRLSRCLGELEGILTGTRKGWHREPYSV